VLSSRTAAPEREANVTGGHRAPHSLKVTGSNPVPATKIDTKTQQFQWIAGFLFLRSNRCPNKINDLVS
jgi:hypothetical protein